MPPSAISNALAGRHRTGKSPLLMTEQSDSSKSPGLRAIDRYQGLPDRCEIGGQRATTSLPVPVSPSIKTVAGFAATCMTNCRTNSIASVCPMRC